MKRGRLLPLRIMAVAGLLALADAGCAGEGRFLYAGDDDWDWASPLNAEKPSGLSKYGAMPWSALDWIEEGLDEVNAALVGSPPEVGSYLDMEALRTLRGKGRTYRRQAEVTGGVAKALAMEPRPNVIILMDDTGKAGRPNGEDIAGLVEFLDAGGRLLVLDDRTAYVGILNAVVKAATMLPADRLPPAPAPPGPEMVERVGAIVARLGADAFRTREDATAELQELGLGALEIAEGMNPTAPEVVARLARVREALAPPIPEKADGQPLDEQHLAAARRVREAADALEAAGLDCDLMMTSVNGGGDPLECLRVVYPAK